ncbi:MAG: beta-galactosidase, partial [Edaphobacter sp.]
MKRSGINVVLINCFKGLGLEAERADIASARRFTELAHRQGLRVIGYVGSSMVPETFYAEEPEAAKWEQIDERGRPMYYSTQTFRHAACRNNPGYRAFLKKVVRLGAVELKLDGFHFDQLQWWPEPWSCHCRYCEDGFRSYLRSKYNDQQLRARLGHANVAGIRVPDFNLERPPVAWAGSVDDPLLQEWAQYRCGSLAQWWAEMREYIRELNPEASLQGNSTVPPGMNHGFVYGNDLGQLLPHCELMWTEDRNEPRWMADGRLVSRIREYKMARTMGRSLLFWQRVEGPQGDYKPPFPELPLTLGLAEAMAYNDANLGVWNSEDKSEPVPGSRPALYVRFFHSHVADLVETRIIADVAVL